jgi:L-2-hydroxyglutarate oxidase LhgO
MTHHVDAVVIGAGVVGLACARALAGVGLETLILERENSFGQGISSRNSEVIHAGLYYKPGSLKARLCRDGRDLLYDYCDRNFVPYKRIGKWIVANGPQQIAELAKIEASAKNNSCSDVFRLTGSEAQQLEPELRAEQILVSPSTGIIDSHALMLSLLADVEANGGQLVVNTEVDCVSFSAHGIDVKINDEHGTVLSTRYLINSAGLSAVSLTKKMLDYPTDLIPESCLAKGNYFSLTGAAPFSRLIYPVPEIGGLGVHLTLDLAGRGRFGPDVEWVNNLEFGVSRSPEKIEKFCKAIRDYWPACTIERLQPDYAGIRPKLGSPSDFQKDFVIQSPREHGIAGLVNLLGIESPGLTSCLAIAEEVLLRLGMVEHLKK